MNKSGILITCPKGIPAVLRQELLGLGFPVLDELVSGVETEGTFDDAMRMNLFVRTGHRVLVKAGVFEARNAEELYRRVTAMGWEDVIPDRGYVCITASVENRSIRDPRFAAVKCKDAIVDRIRARRGTRPDSGPDRDHSVVHLYWKHDRCTIYLDSSGEPLSRRGYRKIPLTAPMQETLAAAVVLTTQWDGRGNFINPLCGSGTIAIEAALLGLGRPPGLLRDNFGFMHLREFNEPRWREMRNQALRGAEPSLSGRIIATDIDPGAVEAARKNAAAAGVEHLIEFGVCDVADTPVPAGGGVVVMNPPYGERMGDRAGLEPMYRHLGDYLKQKCGGYTGYVFTGNPSLAGKVGLKPKRTWHFQNSGIPCRLQEYDLYEGSRKMKKPKPASAS